MQDYINKIICGDNVKVLSGFPDGCIDLIVTSPPYDNIRDYEGYNFAFEQLAWGLWRIMKKGAVLVWVVGDETVNGSESGTSFYQALFFRNNCGLNLHDTMIYEKNTAAFPPTNRYEQVFEYMFIFSKNKPKVVNLIKDKKNMWAGTKNFGEISNRSKDGKLIKDGKHIVADFGIRTCIWRYNTGFGYSSEDKEAFEHPAIFPEKLARDHILSWSNEDDIVLDPMCGSGTTCKMAYRYKRKFIGIDISEKYCRIARQRMKDEMSQLTLF